MIDVIVGMFVGVAAGTAARAYVRWLHRDAVPEPEFERFAASRPLVAALHCRAEPGPPGTEHGQAHRAASELLTLLRGGRATCEAGRHPWPRYVFDVDVAYPSRRVVMVRLRAATLRREGSHPPALLDLVRALVRECPFVDEVWLRGELFEGGLREDADRSRFGWVAQRDERGALELAPMIGAPPWLQALPHPPG